MYQTLKKDDFNLIVYSKYIIFSMQVTKLREDVMYLSNFSDDLHEKSEVIWSRIKSNLKHIACFFLLLVHNFWI